MEFSEVGLLLCLMVNLIFRVPLPERNVDVCLLVRPLGA